VKFNAGARRVIQGTDGSFTMIWPQTYNPLGNQIFSTLVAALPVVVLLGGLAMGHLRVWVAALLGLGTALGVALLAYGMPVPAAIGSAAFGGAYGLFPIGWIVLNVMFLHALTVRSGCFEALRSRLAGFVPDARIQVILVAYSFGGFIEGSAGFGAPVAITAAMLMGLGFKPLKASVLALIANTAPVAFGSVGIPITTLAQITGLDVLKLSSMAGRQLPLFSLLIPFWVVCAFCGWRGMVGVWPAALAAGGSFAIVQFLVSNLHGPWLVDTAAGLASMLSLVGVLRFWQPKTLWTPDGIPSSGTSTPTPVSGLNPTPSTHPTSTSTTGTASHLASFTAQGDRLTDRQPWLPWALLAGCLFIWGLPTVKQALDRSVAPGIEVPGLHQQVQRTPPVVPPPTDTDPIQPEQAVYKLNILSATGTGILIAALVFAMILRARPRDVAVVYAQTFMKVRVSLFTIAAMLALGNVTKYSGADATMGLALAGTGSLYPFFGTLLGWLGVALTGSDTASNVLFGSLQRITAEQLGLSPYLMAAANSVGGVMGKMIDAQSIVVASVATQFHGQEGRILRHVFFHSVALAVLVGLWITVLAKVSLFSSWVIW
jgi:lactate permease